MAFPGLEPTSAHLTYLILSLFLVSYALFSELISNRLHLSEPPLATLVGIIFGPKGIVSLNPQRWGWEDNITQEVTRMVVGVQVFAIAIELPQKYMKNHLRSVAMLLGPVMAFGWIASALIVYLILQTKFTTALIIAACLTPTDPVLAASVVGESRFSQRVPKRIKQLLQAESGCNDGISFPFLYAGLLAVTTSTAGMGIKDWLLQVIFWQCSVGTFIGIVIGYTANKLLRFSEGRNYIMDSSFFVFYFLLAIFCVGIGSTLGSDDFLVAFGAGTAFGWDGWFASKTLKTKLPNVLDMLLNSSMFVYFGASIPWHSFKGDLGPGRLVACLVLILLLRRIPVVLALKKWIPNIKTYSEALFAGHFGPMGVGALFLAIEARARLETQTSRPLPHPPKHSPNEEAINTIWPVICFVVLGSIMVHGLSPAILSVVSHFSRPTKERAPLIGEETDRLYGMAEENGRLTQGGATTTSDSESSDD
jgi:NhaP-type Na+/H+ or K+/H+ antiporter